MAGACSFHAISTRLYHIYRAYMRVTHTRLRTPARDTCACVREEPALPRPLPARVWSDWTGKGEDDRKDRSLAGLLLAGSGYAIQAHRASERVSAASSRFANVAGR